MNKIIKYALSVMLSAAAIFFAYRFVGGSLAGSMDKYAESINDSIEQKRQALLLDGVFRDGITVNGVSVGGMSMDEARRALEPVEESLVGEIGFTVKYGEDGEVDIGRDYFTVSYDTDKVLEEAMLIAQDGSYEELRSKINELQQNGLEYTISCTVTPDVDRMAEVVTEAAESLNVEPVNASMKPNPNSVKNGGDRFKIKGGKNGYRAHTEEAVNEIISRAKAADYGVITITGEEVEPAIKKSDLENSVVLRASYKSSYSHSPYNAPNRVANIIKACDLVNGTILYSKDSGKKYKFSINDCLGPRTEAGGWLPAPGFIAGGAISVDSPGGGVCHVSSTLYNAVVRADLEVVYRINHSSHVGYVPWGLDATISTGGPDFKFANNTKHPVYIFMWVDSRKQTVNCEIWGDPFPSRFTKIDFYAELVEEIPPTETEYIVDRNLAPNYWYVQNYAKTGYKYQSYVQYYKGSTPVGEPKKVATSVYRMHPKRICVWPGFDPNVDVLSNAYRLEPPDPNS
ncbi:MAG: VanW family protein [Clostridia bacterium]|nr:VanW family protein [Clostridia bacterium]